MVSGVRRDKSTESLIYVALNSLNRSFRSSINPKVIHSDPLSLSLGAVALLRAVTGLGASFGPSLPVLWRRKKNWSGSVARPKR